MFAYPTLTSIYVFTQFYLQFHCDTDTTRVILTSDLCLYIHPLTVQTLILHFEIIPTLWSRKVRLRGAASGRQDEALSPAARPQRASRGQPACGVLAFVHLPRQGRLSAHAPRRI